VKIKSDKKTNEKIGSRKQEKHEGCGDEVWELAIKIRIVETNGKWENNDT
jgi:hypothetical protein